MQNTGKHRNAKHWQQQNCKTLPNTSFLSKFLTADWKALNNVLMCCLICENQPGQPFFAMSVFLQLFLLAVLHFIRKLSLCANIPMSFLNFYNLTSCIFYLISFIACHCLCSIPYLPSLITRKLWLSAKIFGFCRTGFDSKTQLSFLLDSLFSQAQFHFNFVFCLLIFNRQAKNTKHSSN